MPFVVTGTNFVDGATVALTADGEVTINATGVLVNSETEIAGNFDLSDASPGLYDVVVTNPDDQSASLTTGFLITAAEEESLEVANLTVVSDTTIGEYEKFELAFSIEGSQATAPQFPYDPDPPEGVDGSEGITLVFPPNDCRRYTQPAFYYQEFEDLYVNDTHPTNNFHWG